MGAPVNIRDQSYDTVLWRINRLILNQLEKDKLTQEIVNAIFEELNADQLGYALIALLLVDEQRSCLYRTAISSTEYSKSILDTIPDYFQKVINPLTDKSNVCVQAYWDHKARVVDSWDNIMSPNIAPEVSRPLLEKLGIKVIVVQPIIFGDKCLGILNFNLTKDYDGIGEHEKELLQGITSAAAIALENSRLYEKLKDLDRLKDEFLSLATHELRTPMTAIKGYSYELMKGKSDKVGLYSERIYKSTDRLVNLVNDMLDVARIESGRVILKIEDFDIINTVAEVIADLSAKAKEKDLQLKMIPAEKVQVLVHADCEKVVQVLMNVIGNALKFTPNKGEVTVMVHKDDYGYVQIDVTDTGVGMDAEDLGKLFGKFVRVKSGEGVSGTGLGLHLSKNIVELMGGRMSAFSKGSGQGSTFSFTIKAT